ncbi:MAG: mandelate racemase/muconate lactonizing enzyme family protein [Gemmatimonadetes bacterium]|jgi:galactonate dehydratase|nr:mandelate racemase/muconate lactonizing enzyme family protein [Gemmatimonadota bacterium]MBT6149741.1 mandelate racemase/muconate lactonizing enzyme family protein [Gemmatimonadota bacterium]MBT7863005.1 mandelate racemase/muconate lactonizing enzyme family protein [Gemmatimonadota bacterium]
MRITSVHTIPVTPTGHGTLGYLVVVRTESGLAGVGEIASDCHPSTVAHAVRQFDLIGRDASRVEELYQSLYAGAFWRGGPIHTSAISAVEQALWDLKGKRLGVPVYELIGGKVRDRVQLYTHARFGNEGNEEFVDSAREAMDLGFEAVKFDPLGLATIQLDGRQLRDAVERVALIREAVGDDAEILIEGHGRLSADAAIRFAEGAADFEPFFYEEPCPPENPEEIARVAASTSIPIAAGERCYSRWAFRALFEAGALAYAQPDLCHCGGFWEGRKIAAMAEVYRVRVMPHNPNGPISTLVGVHLAACTPNFGLLEYPRQPAQTAPVLQGLPQVVDGHIEVPDRPGWGVEIDEDVLAQYPPEDSTI